jgi:hypothetical protein
MVSWREQTHGKRIAMLSALWEVLTNCLAGKWVNSLSRDNGDDPIYRQNLQNLIERNRQFEEKSDDRHS